ncbi:HIT family protein [Pedococcus ginsenosidimutans]|uniref:HIT family protein n=1 Tax=Pedococcus ginsenosidimutans TaxID=490570 RepID=A0ABP8Y1D3_9MICO
MDCLFCGIVDGTVPSHVVLDEPYVLGFLDTRPLFKGHVLLVPRIHVDTLPDLPAELVPVLMGAVQRMASGVVRALGSQGSFVAVNNVVSQSVPHLHVHVVPRTKGDGLRGFFWPRTKYASDDEAQEYAARLAAALDPPVAP